MGCGRSLENYSLIMKGFKNLRNCAHDRMYNPESDDTNFDIILALLSHTEELELTLI